MFEPITLYRIYCDQPGCIRVVMDHDYESPLLVKDARVDQILLTGFATDADGEPWVLWPERNRLMCSDHGHHLEAEKNIAATHDPLF